MEATIAVAAITAGSTLAAAALTGYFTLALHNRQAKAEECRAREEARRSAYADFLTASTAAGQSIEKVWDLSPAASPDPVVPQEIYDALERLAALDHALHVAVLHGPSSIAESAGAVYLGSRRELSEAMELMIGNASDPRPARVIRQATEPTREALRVLRHAAFAGQAMRALGVSDDA